MIRSAQPLVCDAGADAFWTAVLGTAPTRADTGSSASPVLLRLASDDVKRDADRLRGLGATRDEADGWASPAGLPFVLGPASGVSTTPHVLGRAGRVRVVQVSIDVPDPLAEAEADFWRQATGWRAQSLSCPEFVTRLVPSSGVGVQLLVQRLGADDPATVAQAHLDLGCDDYRAAANRMAELGAVRRWDGRDGWVTLADPAGMIFCATENSPDAPAAAA